MGELFESLKELRAASKGKNKYFFKVIREMRAKRSVEKGLRDCDFRAASQDLRKTFDGTVIPKELACLLTCYGENPCMETAWGLIHYDPKFIEIFYSRKRTLIR